jgi:hypothetical protein
MQTLSILIIGIKDRMIETEASKILKYSQQFSRYFKRAI